MGSWTTHTSTGPATLAFYLLRRNRARITERLGVVSPAAIQLQLRGSLLNTLHTQARSLAFVTLSSEMTVSTLVATRPFLLLAILAVTSGAKPAQKHV